MYSFKEGVHDTRHTLKVCVFLIKRKCLEVHDIVLYLNTLLDREELDNK